MAEIINQDAIHGLLKKIRDLGIPLLSVNRIQSDSENKLDQKLD